MVLWWMASSRRTLRRSERRGYGRWHSGITSITRRRTATRRRARPRWRRSPRAGGRSDNIPIRRNAHRATLLVGVESGLDLIEPSVHHKTNPERQNHDQQDHFDAHAGAPDPVG